jgi:hypothetical protein
LKRVVRKVEEGSEKGQRVLRKLVKEGIEAKVD